MEKIAIISDVHGNITALNEVIKDIKNKGINRIICLGDIVGKCANPDLVIDTIRKECEVVVKGNIDEIMSSNIASERKYWTRQKIGDERAEYLNNLPVSYEMYISGHLIRFFHSSPIALDYIYNPVYLNLETKYKYSTIKDYKDMFKNTEFIGKNENDSIPNVIGYGHLHTPFIFRMGNKTIFNAGSVGVPVEMLNNDKTDKENIFTTMASYIIIEGNIDSKELSEISFNVCRVKYNIEKEIEYLENTDMYNKEKIIEALKTGISNI